MYSQTLRARILLLSLVSSNRKILLKKTMKNMNILLQMELKLSKVHSNFIKAEDFKMMSI
jgi:hypothetical protein